MDRSKLSFLGSSALLSRLPPTLLVRAVRMMRPIRVARRRDVWVPGDTSDHLYFVRSGVVRIGQELEARHELVLAFHGKGEIFGEVGAVSAALGAAAARHTRAVAHEELVAYGLAVPQLQSLMAEANEVGVQLAGLVADRRREVENRLGRLLFQPVPVRMASALLDLARRFGVRDSRGVIVALRLTQRELAAIVGSTRETVSTTLAAWRREGLLQVEGKRIVLLDPEQLFALAGGDAR